MYVCAFFPPLFNFFRLPLKVLVRVPGGTRTPSWESLLYSIVMTKAAALYCTMQFIRV
jgi:hypothetical protein